MKRHHVKAIVIVTAPSLAIVFVFLLFILHPMLRTVEPQMMHYNIILDNLDESEQDMVLEAASMAFASWEKDNPGLVFEEDNGGMTIIIMYWFPDFLANAVSICPFLGNSENWCCILVSPNIVLDHLDRHGNKNSIANLLAHEIGHVLGFMHTSTQGHLMHGPLGSTFDWTYDQEHVFVVPERRSLHD